MKINIEIDEDELKKLVYQQIQSMMPDITIEKEDIKIEVWEPAAFRATYTNYK